MSRLLAKIPAQSRSPERAYQFLSLEALAAIASAPPTTTAADLARLLGRSYFTVAQAVRRIRQAGGWYTPLRWNPCVTCGLAVASGSHGTRTVHVTCQRPRRPTVKRPWQAHWRRDPERARAAKRAWRQRHPEAVARERARDHQRRVERNAQVRASATGVGARWTEDELRYLREHATEPVLQVALHLGRTLDSVLSRLRRLKEPA